MERISHFLFLFYEKKKNLIYRVTHTTQSYYNTMTYVHIHIFFILFYSILYPHYRKKIDKETYIIIIYYISNDKKLLI